MLEAITSFVEFNVIWFAIGAFLLTICKIAFDIFKERERHKMAEKGFRGALPKVIHRAM